MRSSTTKTNTSSPLLDRISQMELQSRKREEREAFPALSGTRSVQLPLWAEDVRGLPNALARSALFTVTGADRETGKRTMFKKRLVASIRGTKIEYTGELLNQNDEDVMLQAIHLSRLMPLGECVEFTAHAFIRQLGWTINSRSYVRLRDCLDRLKATGVIISVDGETKGFNGSLIRKFMWTTEDGMTKLTRWRVWLEPEIIALFGPVSYSKIEWDQRLRLSPLAKWMHAFFATHREPFGYKLVTLKELCGSETKQLFHFRKRIKKALAELQEVGFLKSWLVCPKTDIVNVTRIFH